MKEIHKWNTEKINVPQETYIECDGWYLICPNCWHSDIEPFTNRCEKCNQLFDWKWLEKIRKEK